MTRFKGAIRRRDDGAVAVVVALMAVVLFGMGAMAVDLGNAWSRKRMTQTDADLSALAGASLLPVTDSASQLAACSRAYAYLAKSGNLPSSDNGAGIPALTSYCPVQVNGDITFPDSTHIRVVSPQRQVDFGLAGVFGFKNVNVSSVAVATINSPNVGILPFILAAGVATSGGNVCIKANTSDKGCGLSSSGNFGYADFPRDDAFKTQSLQANIAVGLQKEATPKLFQAACLYYYGGTQPTGNLCGGTSLNAPKPNADLQCSDPALYDESFKPHTQIAATGALTEPSSPSKNNPLVNGETCVTANTGNMGNKLTDGLLTWNGNGSCSGRLGTSDSSAAVIIGNCRVIPDRYASYGTPLSADIVKDKRFGIVPIISQVPTTGKSDDYAILTFYGLYIHNFYDNNGNTICPGNSPCTSSKNIEAFDASVFPLSDLPSTVPGSTLPIYIGTGPVVPVLSPDN